MSRKRPSKKPPEREPSELKQPKATPPKPTNKFLFKTKHEHTKFIRFDREITLTDLSFRAPEVIEIEVPKVEGPLEIEYDQNKLHQYLQNYLAHARNQDIGDMIIEGEKNQKNDQHQQEEMNLISEIREQLVFNLYQEFRPQNIAESLGLTCKEVYNIQAKLKKRKDKISEVKEPKRFIVTPEMYAELENYIKKRSNKVQSLREIRDHLIKEFKLEERGMAESTVWNMLYRLKYRRKRVKLVAERKNISSTITKRREVAKKYISALMQDKELIFIDETGFNHAMKPLYGYALLGERCSVPSIVKGENHSVIVAITKSRVLGYQIFKKSVKAQDFGAFIAGLLQNYREIVEERSKYILFMDNATIHTSQELKPLFSRLNILFNAPYSPSLNPIEEFFGNCKFNFRKKYAQNTIGIAQKIKNSIHDIDTALLNFSFLHSLSFLHDCLQENPIH